MDNGFLSYNKGKRKIISTFLFTITRTLRKEEILNLN